MIECPKCGAKSIAGPRYKKHRWGGESLEYICNRCGYSEDRPTRDAENKDEFSPQEEKT